MSAGLSTQSVYSRLGAGDPSSRVHVLVEGKRYLVVGITVQHDNRQPVELTVTEIKPSPSRRELLAELTRITQLLSEEDYR